MRQHFKFFIIFCFLSPCFTQAQEPACAANFSKPAHAKRQTAKRSKTKISHQRRRPGPQQKYITLEEAKAYMREHFSDVDSSKKYHRFIQSAEGHPLMPANPARTYKKQGWVDWADFLGTDNISTRIKHENFFSYEEAMAWVREHIPHINDRDKFFIWASSSERHPLMPTTPHRNYKDQGWVSWGVFLGTGRVSSLKQHQQYLPLYQAIRVVRRKGFKLSTEYREWHLKTKPTNLPLNPGKSYKKQGWPGWTVFLGLKKMNQWSKKDRLPLEEARLYMMSQGLRNKREFDKWGREGKRPSFIPANPSRYYEKEGWKEKGGMKYFLGVKKLNYEDAKELIQILGIETRQEYELFAQTKPYSDLLPLHPRFTYKEFEGWKIFLGQYMKLSTAKIYIRKKGFNTLEFLAWLKSDARPPHFPENPQEYYKEDWPGLTAFLGIRWMPLKEAQEFIQQYGLISSVEFYQWLRSNKEDLPKNFPTNPPAAYEKQWPGWDAFLGISSEGEVSDPSSKKSAENFSDTEKDLEKEFRKRPVEEQKHIL